MKNLIILIISILFTQNTVAQRHEIGIFVGASSYLGDVGPSRFINPNEFAGGILYKWNKTPRHSWRLSYMQSTITSRDADANVQSRITRNYAFKNSIKEGSIGLEFNFLPFDLNNLDKQWTPYIYSGVSYFGYSELYHLNSIHKIDYNSSQFAIPMIIGMKMNVSERFVLGFEYGARYTFTDNLDGSNPKNPNLSTLRFGNLNSMDWFSFMGATLTYTFGKKPCNCNY